MAYRQVKIVFLAFVAVTVATMVAGLIVASLGHKDIADKFLGPALLITFGFAVIVGACLNYRYVGWAWDNWRGYSSQSHRRSSYLVGIALLMFAGIALIAGGIVLLLVKSSN